MPDVLIELIAIWAVALIWAGVAYYFANNKKMVRTFSAIVAIGLLAYTLKALL